MPKVRLYDIVSALQKDGYKLSIRAFTAEGNDDNHVMLLVIKVQEDGSSEDLVAAHRLHNNVIGWYEEDRLWETVSKFERQAKSETA
ncbi:hypothetical protein [Bradyrhizobium sp. BR13661]|jgi:hypothetical protein|uniref:hypothetical protein n=1 Tax=Bradyrhizobium sp. BR13661 TaxID=2940622 RepID=UPI0024753863|nr:hypothetical protein [Bradyrhizobium sp. BR13661]MDH6259085.1 hypothetical protein [Bradyrhizobium sp. BR13661]